jgi:crotonobetainyl-CoA:carnitine CoA-transferase CaiB-like acyl-CoA transferase
VNDVMGGMFGVIAIQAALAERQHTGRGRHIQSALFENNVFLMAQHMMYEAAATSAAWPGSAMRASPPRRAASSSGCG